MGDRRKELCCPEYLNDEFVIDGVTVREYLVPEYRPGFWILVWESGPPPRPVVWNQGPKGGTKQQTVDQARPSVRTAYHGVDWKAWEQEYARKMELIDQIEDRLVELQRREIEEN